MTNIIERLRFYANGPLVLHDVLGDAADEVERLTMEVRELKTQAMFSRSTIERMQMQIDALTTERDGLRKALHLIIASGSDDTYAVGIARAALDGKP